MIDVLNKKCAILERMYELTLKLAPLMDNTQEDDVLEEIDRLISKRQSCIAEYDAIDSTSYEHIDAATKEKIEQLKNTERTLLEKIIEQDNINTQKFEKQLSELEADVKNSKEAVREINAYVKAETYEQGMVFDSKH